MRNNDLFVFFSTAILLVEVCFLAGIAVIKSHATEPPAVIIQTVEETTAAPVQETTAAQPPKIIFSPAVEPRTEAAVIETTAAPEPELNAYQLIWQAATEEERELVALILALEAQTEPYDGQRAVVEVILNRVLSDRWPNTIYEVLSQRGQFATWRYRNNPYNIPGEAERTAIADTIARGPEILPQGYVYFATSKVNGRGHIKIKHHYFSY